MSAAPTTKTFGKGTRTVPAPSEKAQKWYPAEDEAQPKKVRQNTCILDIYTECCEEM
jgi:hypothetical protein